MIEPIDYNASQRQSMLAGLAALGSIQNFKQQRMENDRAAAQAERQNYFYAKLNSTPPDQLHTLRTEFPDYAEQVQKEIGIQGAEHAAFVNKSLNNISVAFSSKDPQLVASAIQQGSAALNSMGVSPEEALQLSQNDPQRFGNLLNAAKFATLPIDKQFDVQNDQAQRAHESAQLQETSRHNQTSEQNAIRGQNLVYQSSMTGHNLAAQRLALDQQKFGFDMQQAQMKADQLKDAAPKLTDATSKMIDGSITTAASSQNSANTMNTLADQLEREKPTAGWFGSMQNNLAKISGSDTYIRDLKIRRTQLASSQAVKNLPPGPASDKDIQFAREGIPDDKDSPEVWARWLRGNAKMEQINADYNNFKAEWVSANGNPGQSRKNGNIMGMDVKQGESLNSAAKRFLSSSSQQSDPQASERQPKEAPGGIADGATATNPKTGQKLIYRNGQWLQM